MSPKRKEILSMISGICVLMIIWLVVFANCMWDDIECITGSVPYENYYISDFSGCVFNDCELEGENTLIATGPDIFIVLDGKVTQGIWIRDIALELPEDEKGIQVIKWYWDFGEGYAEVPELTTVWNIDKKQNGPYEKINNELHGMRLDLEYVDNDQESFNLGRIVVNTLSPEELKNDVILYFIIGLLAQIIVIVILIIIKLFKKEHFIPWIIRGILMEVIYFILLPIYQSTLPARIKIPVVIINVFVAVLIACVGVNRDEYKE